MTAGACAELVTAVQQHKTLLDRLAGRAEELAGQVREAEAEEARAAEQAAVWSRAQALLTTIGEEAQDTARAKVEQLATQALQVIFGPEHRCVLEPGERGGQATLELRIRSAYPDRVIETGVLDARGGGMAAVLGFVLRLVVLLLHPELRRILLLDETFSFLGASFEARMAEFLRIVADRTGTQIVLVTHSPVYGDAADVRVRFALDPGGVTEVHHGESE